MNLTQNKFLTQKENYKFLKTIEFDNQRIGIVLKNNWSLYIFRYSEGIQLGLVALGLTEVHRSRRWIS